ncbi:MAG: ABC transporter substrate-binding protein [Acinetobacter sp.]
MMRSTCLSLSVVLGMILTGCDNSAKTPDKQTNASESTTTSNAATITIGYSDWPGWVAWQVAIEKGWLKDAGLNINFKWFDYSSSLTAFAANQLDAVMVTNGDNLVTASGGTKGIVILATDYSAGNDVIIAKDGIQSVSDLKGKTVALEKGLVDHHLLNTALRDQNIATHDVKIVNSVTNELPQVFASKDIAAIAVWQPIASQALKSVAGSKIIYTSKDKPGLIYDTVAVSVTSLAQNKEQWTKFVQVWDKVVNYIQDPKTHDDAVKIMANRVGVAPAQYAKMIDGTHLLSVADNKKVFTKGQVFDSIYGSSYYVNEFNVSNGIYKTAVDVDSLIDPSVVEAVK